jgi:transposase InsO family protein
LLSPQRTDPGCRESRFDPGKPWQNGADESFNGKLRDEYLSLQWFRNRVEAKVGIEQWRRHYNEVRPHSSLGYLTPLQFKTRHGADALPTFTQHPTMRGSGFFGPS